MTTLVPAPALRLTGSEDTAIDRARTDMVQPEQFGGLLRSAMIRDAVRAAQPLAPQRFASSTPVPRRVSSVGARRMRRQMPWRRLQAEWRQTLATCAMVAATLIAVTPQWADAGVSTRRMRSYAKAATEEFQREAASAILSAGFLFPCMRGGTPTPVVEEPEEPGDGSVQMPTGWTKGTYGTASAPGVGAFFIADEADRAYYNGTVWNISNNTQLAAALAGYQPRDVLVLEEGVNFDTDEGVVLPGRDGGANAWLCSRTIYNETFGKAPGQRVEAEDVVDMPAIRVAGAGGALCLRLDSDPDQTRVSGWRIDAIHMRSNPGSANNQTTLCFIGGGDDTDADNQLSDIHFNQVYLLGKTGQTEQGLYIGSGVRIGMIHSRIEDISGLGESKAVLITKGTGPFYFDNTFFESLGANFFVGGVSQGNSDFVARDVVVIRCHLYKRPEWITLVQGKNLFETKMVERLLLERCRLENGFNTAQIHGIVIYGTNQDNIHDNYEEVYDNELRDTGYYPFDAASEWHRSRHVTIRYCELLNVSHGMNIFDSGESDFYRNPGHTKDILIEHMLITYHGRWAIQVGGVFENLQVRHVTGYYAGERTDGAGPNYDDAYGTDGGRFFEMEGIINNGAVTDCVMGRWRSGTLSTTQQEIDVHCTGTTTVERSLFWNAGTLSAPTLALGNVSLGAQADILFTNAAGGDFSLQASSPGFGTGAGGNNMGADIAGLNSLLAGVA